MPSVQISVQEQTFAVRLKGLFRSNVRNDDVKLNCLGKSSQEKSCDKSLEQPSAGSGWDLCPQRVVLHLLPASQGAVVDGHSLFPGHPQQERNRRNGSVGGE